MFSRTRCAICISPCSARVLVPDHAATVAPWSSLQIDQVFGSSFNVNGLGGVLTSGLLGVGAGLSHSPVVSLLMPSDSPSLLLR